MKQHQDLVNLLAKSRQERNFIPQQWLDAKVSATSIDFQYETLQVIVWHFQATMFNDYMRNSGLKACVISVSGGVDSAVCLGIVLHAQKQEGSPIQKVKGPSLGDFEFF